MNTAITVTAIICMTLVLLSLISNSGKNNRK